MTTIRTLGPPTNIEIKVHEATKGLIVTFEEPENVGNSAITGFEITDQWFDPAGPMIDPIFISTQEVGCCVKPVFVKFPEHVEAFVPSRTVKIVVVAKNEHGTGGEACKQITWDSSVRSLTGIVKSSLDAHESDLEKALNEFTVVKKTKTVNLILFGMQHNGKSSFLNSLNRTLTQEIERPDQVATGPANNSETTNGVQRLDVHFKAHTLRLIDTPAFSNTSEAMKPKIQALLSYGVSDGARRENMTESASMWVDPPHGAIMVISLVQWRDHKEKTKEWMKDLQNLCKNASGGRIEFPYGVVATNRDIFLGECQLAEPHEELKKAVQEIKNYANTDDVCAVSNYKDTSSWSMETNTEMFRLLRNIIALAKNKDTSWVLSRKRFKLKLFVGFTLGVVLLSATVCRL